MPAADRGQVNCSARRRALLRRRRSGLLMIDVTARAMASGSLSAVAPLSVVRISASAEVLDTTAGVPHASASNAASPNVSGGPGAGGRRVGRGGAGPADEAGEVDGQTCGLPLEPRTHRTLSDDDQSRVDARITQCGNAVNAAVGVLLHRQAATM